ncbi:MULTISPECIES: virulence RhuM family protein [unclassified Parvimonas]|uniref:virulence RhuM family protein n=1 Tax=unclassified Parvimonas TaxID=1151464 RepID=UPI002B483774|nr:MULTISPECIES: virulence RhuM family protein [unclassified Parvimonas]MEB3024850.1 virulence RhuM family protein [Parvimonas sp. M13]MEB3089003.1 virulence RhuM family protein [Parvimonas sp. M20]
MSNEIKQDNGEIVIYNTGDGNTRIDVRFIDDTVWLSQAQLCNLYQTSKSNISEHIKHIFEEGELTEESVVRKFRTTSSDGKNYNVLHYNLDMIISLGYRVKSKIATDFRKWATERLKEYIIKGFTMDDERLKNLGGGVYWKELLERIRDIRSSEKVFYRQILDLFSTSIDYNRNSEEAKHFFATVQNKLHYAIHNHTASEIIYSRVDSEKEFMGLTIFKGELPTLIEAKVAKNYLSEKELKSLNSLVSGYLDFAERQAEKKVVMTMKDWINHVDRVLIAIGEDLLKDNGKISRQQMIEKVEKEYKKYNEKTLTQVEKDYLLEINNIKNIVSKGGADNE